MKDKLKNLLEKNAKIFFFAGPFVATYAWYKFIEKTKEKTPLSIQLPVEETAEKRILELTRKKNEPSYAWIGIGTKQEEHAEEDKHDCVEEEPVQERFAARLCSTQQVSQGEPVKLVLKEDLKTKTLFLTKGSVLYARVFFTSQRCMILVTAAQFGKRSIPFLGKAQDIDLVDGLYCSALLNTLIDDIERIAVEKLMSRISSSEIFQLGRRLYSSRNKKILLTKERKFYIYVIDSDQPKNNHL